MFIIDTLLVLLAALCGPAMIYEMWAAPRRRAGDDLPTSGELFRASWAFVSSVLEATWYGVKVVLAPAREHARPALFRDDYVAGRADDQNDQGVVAHVAEPATRQQHPIAITQNDNNDAVAIAPLARLVAAGKVTQTDAIKIGLRVSPSSTSARYAEVRDALRREVEALNTAEQPQYHLTPAQQAWRRRVGLDEEVAS